MIKSTPVKKPQTTLIMLMLNDAGSLSSSCDHIFQDLIGRERTALLEHHNSSHEIYILWSFSQEEFLANFKPVGA